jgi:hypothetical protein
MIFTLEEQEKILRALQEMPCGVGYEEELKSKLRKQGLSDGAIDGAWDELRLIGVIRQGCDGLNKFRFQLTDFGKRYSDSILSFRKTEAIFTRLKDKLGIS